MNIYHEIKSECQELERKLETMRKSYHDIDSDHVQFTMDLYMKIAAYELRALISTIDRYYPEQ